MRDIGLYVVSAICKPIEELPPRLRVYIAIATPNEVASLYERTRGKKFKIEPITSEDLLGQANLIDQNGITGFQDLVNIVTAGVTEGANEFRHYKDNDYLNTELFEITNDFESAACKSGQFQIYNRSAPVPYVIN